MTSSNSSEAPLRAGAVPRASQEVSSSAAFLESSQVQVLRRTLRENHPTYLHQRVYDAFNELLESGAVDPGDLLPTQHELMSYLHLSRQTLVTALERLLADGFITVQHGRFAVAGPDDSALTTYQSNHKPVRAA